MEGRRKTFKFHIEANFQTIKNTEAWLFLCQNLYNCALEERIKAYKGSHKSISCYMQMNELPELKREFLEYKNIDAQVLQNVLERLEKAYQAFFRRIKKGQKAGFPRFKSRNRYDSFTLKQNGWKINGKYLSIAKLGTFKLFLSRPIEGRIKTVTIKRNPTNKWYVYFSCDNVSLKLLPKANKEIGIDVGLKLFLTMSDGTKIENPRFLNKAKEALRVRQQKLSKKKKGSNRRKKARILVAKIHEKIANQRKDFHYKLANQLVKYYDTIYIEDIKFWNTDNKNFNRLMRDAAWFGFFDILQFKAEEAGKEVIKVSAKNTSQVCSKCDVVVPKDVNIRIHQCPHCGLVMDRDHNAALNIFGLGQSLRKKLSSTSNSENLRKLECQEKDSPYLED